ncbi:hypothetical protein [Paratractidigestivibacter sp.]|uniref:hypothetical protein n=1 Tax=Paratractidigestivibacter sp. TaxID=2847316 RepID=UPI002ABE03DF|nr:hypothetical protein [Paratractidigestivibacter sp.]
MVEVSQGFLGEGKEFGEEAFFSAYFELLERVSSTANLANEAEARANRPILGIIAPEASWVAGADAGRRGGADEHGFPLPKS